jgi:hypothetical protein
MAIKRTLGCQPKHESFYSKNITKETLRGVTYDKETKRLSVTFVHQGQERFHEIRLKRVYPPMLSEFCTFLEMQGVRP